MILDSNYISGIGIDILSVKRVNSLFVKYKYKFLDKVLGSLERDCFNKRFDANYHRGIRYIATRISAKEALSKAMGIGMTFPLSWSSIEILNSFNGKPYYFFSSDLDKWIKERYGVIHISLSDEHDLVMSNVIIENKKI
ncbi:MAG: holo-ACP synthase [Candidatus Kinetoplastibacterium crithidii]|nr:MAG: holo-ACP synthase [Candidatus Kinetoplastibacterium crithidii]